MATVSKQAEPPFKNLQALITKCEAIASENGFLITYKPKPQSITENNMEYTLCLAENLANKPIAIKKKNTDTNQKSKAFDPFAGPFTTGAHICNLGNNKEYRLILNKFPCLPSHILLVSTAYIRQTDLLKKTDFEMAYKIFASLLLDETNTNPLLFFNSGIHSGATQMHRHLHFVPNCGQRLLLNEIAETMKAQKTEEKEQTNGDAMDAGIQIFDRFDFLHGMVLLDSDIGGNQLNACYHGILKMIRNKMNENDVKEDEFSYNLLMTEKILLIVARKCGVFEGVLNDNEKCSFAVNALSFGGLIFCNSEKQMQLCRKYGVTKMIEQCTFQKNTE